MVQLVWKRELVEQVVTVLGNLLNRDRRVECPRLCDQLGVDSVLSNEVYLELRRYEWSHRIIAFRREIRIANTIVSTQIAMPRVATAL